MTLDEQLEQKTDTTRTLLRHGVYFASGFVVGAVFEAIDPSWHGFGSGFLGAVNGGRHADYVTKQKGEERLPFFQRLGYALLSVPTTVGGYVAGAYTVAGLKNLF